MTPLLRFLDHTQLDTYTAVEVLWTSDRMHAEAANYTIHNTHWKRTSMSSTVFEPSIPAIYAL